MTSLGVGIGVMLWNKSQGDTSALTAIAAVAV